MQDFKKAAKEKASRQQKTRKKIKDERQKAAKSRDHGLHEYLKKKLDEHVARKAAAKAAAEKGKGK